MSADVIGRNNVDSEKRVLLLHTLMHNKRVGNNDVEVLFYIICSTPEIAAKTFNLLKQVQPFTVSDRSGIPFSLMSQMNHYTPVSNLWRFADLLEDDHALLSLELVKDAPVATEYTPEIDLVIRHTSVYQGA
jgi:hypothetical protein